jgi:hypothetical protein
MVYQVPKDGDGSSEMRRSTGDKGLMAATISRVKIPSREAASLVDQVWHASGIRPQGVEEHPDDLARLCACADIREC